MEETSSSSSTGITACTSDEHYAHVPMDEVRDEYWNEWQETTHEDWRYAPADGTSVRRADTGGHRQAPRSWAAALVFTSREDACVTASGSCGRRAGRGASEKCCMWMALTHERTRPQTSASRRSRKSGASSRCLAARIRAVRNPITRPWAESTAHRVVAMNSPSASAPSCIAESIRT